MKKGDYRNILILIFLSFIIIIGIFLCGNIFGANMDWINQHTVIPEYFREYFYEHKKLIPDVIYNLGLGENAFNFSYYGLLSPIILISYLLPFIDMTTYIIVSSIIIYSLTIYLFYKFLRSKFDTKLTMLLTLLFMCSSPILFHFHRHIMFVNYLPFLLMALINVDKFDQKRNKIFLIINILCMILTSYYFSVGGIFTVLIYYFYLNYNKPLKEKMKIFIPVIISILLSSVLIIPTLSSILNSRDVVTTTTNLLLVFIPNFNYSDILYGSYALGLFSITIISTIYFILKSDKSYKFLSIIIFILISLPICRYLLNGGLYIRSKVLIPFLPLLILIIGIFLKDLFENKIEFRKLTIGIFIIALLGLFSFNLVYYLDLLFTTIFLYLYYKFKNKNIIMLPLLILAISTLLVSNLNEKYVSYDEYKSLEKNNTVINKLIKSDSEFYRISELNNTLYNVNRNFSHKHYKTSIYSSTINEYYKNFYYNTLKLNNNNYNNLIIRDTDNIIFNSLTNVKYVISDKNLGYGYSYIKDNIYQNNYVNSLGYATSNVYSINKFNELNYPYNLKYLLNGIVVDDNYNNDTSDIIEEYDLNLIEEFNKFVSLEQKNNSYYFKVDSDKKFTINLRDSLENKLLFITINGLESNSCSEDDISITINNQANSLSCDNWWYHNQNYAFNYLINEKNLQELDVVIKKGNYKIDSITLYTMDIKYLNNQFDQMTNITIKDNILEGNIHVTEDGYMNLSIPYDKSFKIFVDGKQVNFEKTNISFIGFKINEGIHNVKLIYNADGLILGKVISMFGLLFFVIYLFGLLKLKTKFVKIK